MKFTYFKKTGEFYIDTEYGREYDGDDGYDFEYEVDSEDVNDALIDILCDEYFKKVSKDDIKESLKVLIDECDIQNELEEIFKENLKEIFKEEAMQSLE